MLKCVSCASEVDEAAEVCAVCGTPVATVAMAATVAMSRTSSTARSTSSGFEDEGRFPPGTLIAERYRIIGRLGRGGMGEVYRATDIRLGQTVAIKFLPEDMAANPAALARFHQEVRLARQVTHPNVCRVYDIGMDGAHAFLTMEYVDGENLASLLRRIGRLQQDKAVEIARKLCAGLAAAHARGVLHRDLKPANIMIDGRGQVLITDFGLAGVAGEIEGAEVRNGTPAYMAPEQLAGKEVSAKSDLYALGLVLYEVFTGKQANAAGRDRPSVSALAPDIDAKVERVIAQCLDPEPKQRPASALAVAAALPGVDVLAGILAAGETPSPEVVAAAGETEAIDKRLAMALFAVFIVALIAMVPLMGSISQFRFLNPDLPEQALAYKARTLLATLGYNAPARDRAYEVSYYNSYEEYMNHHRPANRSWEEIVRLPPEALRFDYRESPRPLEATNMVGRVAQDDPAFNISGMIRISMDTDGRLLSFEAVPPQYEVKPAPAATPVNATALLAASGVNLSSLKPAEPRWVPETAVDWRTAWTGTYPNRPELPLRIELGGWRGKAVYFAVNGPWVQPNRMAEMMEHADERGQRLVDLFLSALTILAAVLAWRNLKLGRGDRRGAFRTAAAVFVSILVAVLLAGHHHLDNWEASLHMHDIGWALWRGASVWLVYIALEPHVRRWWPHTMITWSRLLGGGVRDPLVGRDLLYGGLFGFASAAIFCGLSYGLRAQGGLPYMGFGDPAISGSVPLTLSQIFSYVYGALYGAFRLLLLFFVLRLICRKEWLAAIPFVAIFVCSQGLTSDYPVPFSIALGILYALNVVVLLRHGILTLMCMLFTLNLITAGIRTANLTVWYSTSTVMTIVALLLLGVYAFRTALAGRSVWAS